MSDEPKIAFAWAVIAPSGFISKSGCDYLRIIPDEYGSGGAAIYRMTPCSRKIAYDRQPTQGFQLPPSIRCIVPELLLADETLVDPEYDEDERSF